MTAATVRAFNPEAGSRIKEVADSLEERANRAQERSLEQDKKIRESKMEAIEKEKVISAAVKTMAEEKAQQTKGVSHTRTQGTKNKSHNQPQSTESEIRFPKLDLDFKARHQHNPRQTNVNSCTPAANKEC